MMQKMCVWSITKGHLITYISHVALVAMTVVKRFLYQICWLLFRGCHGAAQTFNSLHGFSIAPSDLETG